MVKNKPLWIAISIMIIGCLVTFFVSHLLWDRAKTTWEHEASQETGLFSSLIFNWIEESYTPIIGLAAVYENSRDMTADEFHGVLGSLQGRSPASFIDELTILRHEEDSNDWTILHTNSYFETMLSQMNANKHGLILETLKKDHCTIPVISSIFFGMPNYQWKVIYWCYPLPESRLNWLEKAILDGFQAHLSC